MIPHTWLLSSVVYPKGNFVLFNVYVPASSGQPLSYKMKFLNALRRAMHIQRVEHNKKVILVGDLNISHRPRDKFWGDRVLFVNDIQNEVNASNDTSSLPRWKVDLATAWPKIEAALGTKKVVSTQTTNPRTSQKYDKFRMTVQVNDKQVFLGRNESSPEYCEYYYDFDAQMYTCPDTDEMLLAEEDNVVCISIVAELLLKIAGIEWNESLQRSIAATEGGTSRVAPPRRWLNAVMEEDGMVDAYESLYPEAEGRYTCWHQFTNKRYTNEGARIDFTLVDSSLAPMIMKGSVSDLRCGCSSKPDTSTSAKSPKHHSNSEAAALCAVTCNGGFQPVSFEGGGIVEATQETLDTQFGTPHTGMIYTPPSFSDHTAISLLLDDECCQCDGQATVLDEKDPLTRKAQPHKLQKSIASFFSASAPSTSSSVSAAAVSTSTANKGNNSLMTKPKKGIHSFLVATTAATTGKKETVTSNTMQLLTSSQPNSSTSAKTKRALSTTNGIQNFLVARTKNIEDGSEKGLKRPKVSEPNVSNDSKPAAKKGSILHHFATKK